MRIGFFGGLCLGFPIFAVQLWKFVAPGLYRNRRAAFRPYLIATPVMFAAGAAFVYYLVMPMAIRFFLSFRSPGGGDALPIQLEAKVSEYLDLIMALIFAFGVCFQLPILLTLLGHVGIITSQSLVTYRRYAIVGVFAVAAVLTPPDVLSQVGLAIPMLALYEASIWIVRAIERARGGRSSPRKTPRTRAVRPSRPACLYRRPLKERTPMHDIKLIRDNPAAFDAGLARRGLSGQSGAILAVDGDLRALMVRLQEMQATRNDAAKKIGQAKAKKDDAEAQRLMAEVAGLKDAIQKGEEEERVLQEKLKTLLSGIPDLPAADVPNGKDETANVEVRRSGAPKNFAFNPREHFEIGEALGLMDFRRRGAFRARGSFF